MTQKLESVMPKSQLTSVGGGNFCLAVEDLGTTQAGISIRGDSMKVNTPLKQSGVSVDDLVLATSFTIWDPSHPQTTSKCNADPEVPELLVRANGAIRGTAFFL